MTSMTSTPENPLPLSRPRYRRRCPAAYRMAAHQSIRVDPLVHHVAAADPVLGKALIGLVQWGFVNAIWIISGDQTGPCRALRGIGACWAVIPEKYRFILFGTYPFNEQWRPALATLTFIALFYLSTRRSLWGNKLVAIWIGALVLIGVLMWGGIFDLTYVSQDRWGGLPVTLILATFGLAFGFPLGICRPRPSLETAGDPLALCALCRIDPRRSADQPLVHGKRDVSAVHARRRQYR